MSRPLVLVHGFTGAPASWDAVRRSLDEDIPVLAPALLGHDGTAGPPAIHAFDDEVDRLAAAVREAGSRGAHLVGYSLGGRVALGLLVRHHGLFAGATLIGTHPGLADPAARADRAARDAQWARLLEREGLPTFVAAWEALPLFATQAALDPAVLARQRALRMAHDSAGLARALRVLGLAVMPDYRPRLAGLDLPVTLVAGEADAKFRALAGEMRERIPGARLEIATGAGHNVVLERPDWIAGLIQEHSG